MELTKIIINIIIIKVFIYEIGFKMLFTQIIRIFVKAKFIRFYHFDNHNSLISSYDFIYTICLYQISEN
jgi:hypothetical protein